MGACVGVPDVDMMKRKCSKTKKKKKQVGNVVSDNIQKWQPGFYTPQGSVWVRAVCYIL